ncbi:MAG: hypothetical protein R6W86_05710 [Marinobacter sp.]|uniref:hypothetical protein n=1 Tax=Marinobacter sp. TaxID=50741 RepID=UPI00396E86A7
MSCNDCNRGRYHHYYDAQQAECSLSETKEKLGKDSSFPIPGPNCATLEGQELSNEDAALIDPTENDPAKHLIWKINDDLPLLAPIQKGSKLDPWGKSTIQVFGFNRIGLVEMRAIILQGAQFDAVSTKHPEKSP